MKKLGVGIPLFQAFNPILLTLAYFLFDNHPEVLL